MKRNISIIINGIIKPFVIYVGITFLVSFVYGIMGMITGTIDAKNIGSVNAFFLQAIASIFILCIFIPFYWSFKKTYEIKTQKFSVRKALYVVPLAFGVCIVGNIILSSMMVVDDNEVTKQVFEVAEKYGIVVSLFMVAILIPAVEEIIFRGFVYDAISLLIGKIFAIVFTSIFFGLMHFNITQGIYAVFAGAFLGYVRYKYGSVSYSVFMHLLMNTCSIIFMPVITLYISTKYKIFVIFICIVLIIMSIYKINEYSDNV